MLRKKTNNFDTFVQCINTTGSKRRLLVSTWSGVLFNFNKRVGADELLADEERLPSLTVIFVSIYTLYVSVIKLQPHAACCTGISTTSMLVCSKSS